MLVKFRNRSTHLFSLYLAIFAILVKMMVPLAHANNINPSDQTGFFASLCTSNGIVLISLDTGTNDGNNPKQAPVVNAGSQCPLCSVVEQDVFDFKVTALASIFESTENKHPSVSFTPTDGFLLKQQSIRAPPYFLSA